MLFRSLNGSSYLEARELGKGVGVNYGNIALRDDASFLNDNYFYNGVNGNLKLEDRAIFENQALVGNWGSLELHDDASIENHGNIAGDSLVVLKSRDATITNHGDAVNTVGFIAAPSAPPALPAAPPSTPPSPPPSIDTAPLAGGNDNDDDGDANAADDDDDGADKGDDGDHDDDDDSLSQAMANAAKLSTRDNRQHDLLGLGAGEAPNKMHVPMVVGLAVGAAVVAVLAVAAVVTKHRGKVSVAPWKELDEAQTRQPKDAEAPTSTADDTIESFDGAAPRNTYSQVSALVTKFEVPSCLPATCLPAPSRPTWV